MKKCDCICHTDGRECPIPGGCCLFNNNPRLIPPPKIVKESLTADQVLKMNGLS